MASKGKKVGIIIGAVFGLAAIIGGSVAAVKIIQNKNAQNQNGGTIIDYPDPEPTPEPTPTPTPDPTPDPDPIPDPGPVEITETEYKAMFEEELPGVLETEYNKNYTNEKSKISNVSVKAINYATGDIYFECNRNNRTIFVNASNEDLKNVATFENAYNNAIKSDNLKYDYKSIETTQEKDLANEIASFALEQQEVLDYITENGIDISNYTVLNATEFEAKSGGYRQTDITICSGNKVLTVSLSGRAGTCSTQEEYLQKFKNGYLEKIVNSCQDFAELEVASAETSSETWICTLSSELGNYLQGRSVTTNSGEFQFE